MQRRLLKRLEALPNGTTMCPGKLSRDCGSTLAQARPDLVELAQQRKVILSQRGKSVEATALKGPFRVRRAKHPGVAK
jgi:hypothetical protein